MAEKETQVAASQAPEPVKKSKKGIIITVVVAVILLILAVAGTWYVMDQQVKRQKDETDQAKKELDAKNIEKKKSESEKPTAANQETSKKEVVPSYATDWNKFVSPNYGFTFRYPKNITPAAFAGAATACKVPLTVRDSADEYTRSQGAIGSWVYGEFFRIDIYSGDTTLPVWVKRQDPEGIRNYDAVTLTGTKEAIKISKALNKEVEGYPPLSYTSYVVRDSKYVYEFLGFQNAGFSGDCVSNAATTEQVIRSFNFYD